MKGGKEKGDLLKEGGRIVEGKKNKASCLSGGARAEKNRRLKKRERKG